VAIPPAVSRAGTGRVRTSQTAAARMPNGTPRPPSPGQRPRGYRPAEFPASAFAWRDIAPAGAGREHSCHGPRQSPGSPQRLRPATGGSTLGDGLPDPRLAAGSRRGRTPDEDPRRTDTAPRKSGRRVADERERDAAGVLGPPEPARVPGGTGRGRREFGAGRGVLWPAGGAFGRRAGRGAGRRGVRLRHRSGRGRRLPQGLRAVRGGPSGHHGAAPAHRRGEPHHQGPHARRRRHAARRQLLPAPLVPRVPLPRDAPGARPLHRQGPDLRGSSAGSTASRTSARPRWSTSTPSSSAGPARAPRPSWSGRGGGRSTPSWTWRVPCP
jgi:hypothetical protein